MTEVRPGSGRGSVDLAAAQTLLDRMGSAPRPAGGAAEEAARQVARRDLETAGFTVREEPFSYSAFPGRWATSLGGVLGICLLAATGHLGHRGSPWAALATLAAGGAAIGAAAAWLARRGVLDAPWLRREGVNLVATRGTPTVWVMAHLDSKSQPVPILVRAAAIAASTVICLLAGGVALAHGLGQLGQEWWAPLTMAGIIALLPVAASTVGARSEGAIDNASGCVAVLLAARMHPPGAPLGVILTSAEELGLAGARALARQLPPAICINCDGVDDDGEWTAMHTGAVPRSLLAAVGRAAGRIGVAVRPRRLLPGVLVDGVALADAGWQVVTLSHGSLRTLGRIHTGRDSRRALRGTALPLAARLIATTVDEVR